MNNITEFLNNAKNESHNGVHGRAHNVLTAMTEQIECLDCPAMVTCGSGAKCADAFVQWALGGEDITIQAQINGSAVDHPSHYNAGSIEAIAVIEDWKLGFNLGNTVKYIARAGHKSANPEEDLTKALWYLRRELGVYAPAPEKVEWESARNGNVICKHCGYLESHRTPYCANCGSEMRKI